VVVSNRFGSVADTATLTVTNQTNPDLAARWDFGEGAGSLAADSSGGNNAGVINGPLWDSDTPDGSSYSLRFDGVNDYVDVGMLDVAGNAMTLSTWIKSDNFANCGSRDCRIISKATGVSEQDHYFMLSTIGNGTDTRLRFRLKTGGWTTTLIASSGNLFENQWVHVAAVYDGAAMRLYKDGIQVGSLSKTGAITTDDGVPVWIGGTPPGPGDRPWAGHIDAVRIYTRALSPTEIQGLASNSAP
jgi:hypothetical protein